jgi:hypothetical protein
MSNPVADDPPMNDESSPDTGPSDAQGTSPADEAPSGDRTTPSEEELRARIEEGLRTVRVQDVVLESAVTIVNITARRIAKEDERDLEQARIGIEAVRGLVELLDPEPQAQVRNALSELQMIYAREAGGSEPPAGEAGPESPEQGTMEGETPAKEPGKPPPGLWVPPGST